MLVLLLLLHGIGIGIVIGSNASLRWRRRSAEGIEDAAFVVTARFMVVGAVLVLFF